MAPLPPAKTASDVAQTESAVDLLPRDDVSDAEEVFAGEAASTRMLEVGCGVGNTVIPILQTNK